MNTHYIRPIIDYNKRQENDSYIFDEEKDGSGVILTRDDSGEEYESAEEYCNIDEKRAIIFRHRIESVEADIHWAVQELEKVFDGSEAEGSVFDIASDYLYKAAFVIEEMGAVSEMIRVTMGKVYEDLSVIEAAE
jgi:hypothetical protein